MLMSLKSASVNETVTLTPRLLLKGKPSLLWLSWIGPFSPNSSRVKHYANKIFVSPNDLSLSIAPILPVWESEAAGWFYCISILVPPLTRKMLSDADVFSCGSLVSGLGMGLILWQRFMQKCRADADSPCPWGGFKRDKSKECVCLCC